MSLSNTHTIKLSVDGGAKNINKKTITFTELGWQVIFYSKFPNSFLYFVLCFQADRTEQVSTGKITLTAGGVGRNIADAISRLRLSKGEDPTNTYFIGSVGNDEAGQLLLQSLKHVVSISKNQFCKIFLSNNVLLTSTRIKLEENGKLPVQKYYIECTLQRGAGSSPI